MRRLPACLLAVSLLALALPAAHADPELASFTKPQPTLPATRMLSVRTTAYTHTEPDHLEHGTRTSSGTELRSEMNYTSAAADWSRYPLGTIFCIKGSPTLYVVDDYGRALVGTDTIDLYKPTEAKMKEWGVRNVEIEILSFGSVERSLAILVRKQQHPHCKKMYDALKAVVR